MRGGKSQADNNAVSNQVQMSSEQNHLIEQWIKDYRHELKWLAYSYVKDAYTAEDIIQETFIKAYQKYSSLKDQSLVKHWFYKITVNLCKDHLKSAYVKRIVKKGSDLFLQTPSSIDTPEDYMVKKVDQETITVHILALEHKYKEIILLYYFGEFTLHESSEILHISVNTAKTRLRRARHLLRDKMS